MPLVEATRFTTGCPLIFTGLLQDIGSKRHNIRTAGGFALIVHQPLRPRHSVRYSRRAESDAREKAPAWRDRKHIHRKPHRHSWEHRRLELQSQPADRAASTGSCSRWRIPRATRASVARYSFRFQTPSPEPHLPSARRPSNTDPEMAAECSCRKYSPVSLLNLIAPSELPSPISCP